MTTPATLASTIRRIRLRQHLTLAQVAAACDCTKSLLSKIENGHTVPAVATLVRIAAALGVSVDVLLGQTSAYRTIHEPPASAPLARTEHGYCFRALASARTDKIMQPFLFSVKKGEVRHHTLRHGGEEFVHILEGRVRYRVGSTTYTLGPGESLYFDAEEDHEVIPLSARATYIAVFAEANPETNHTGTRKSPRSPKPARARSS